MYYDAELRFLRDTLHKCRIQTVIADLAAPIGQRMELHPLLTQLIDSNKILYDVLPPLAPAVIYRLTDPLSCRYLLVPLPELPRESVLIIGPYLPSPLTQKQILEQAEKNRIPPFPSEKSGNILCQHSHLAGYQPSVCDAGYLCPAAVGHKHLRSGGCGTGGALLSGHIAQYRCFR